MKNPNNLDYIDAIFDNYGPSIVFSVNGRKNKIYCETLDEANYYVRRIREYNRCYLNNNNPNKIKLPKPNSVVKKYLKKLDCDCRNRYDTPITEDERKLLRIFTKECADEGFEIEDNWTEQEHLLLRNATHGMVPIWGTNRYQHIWLIDVLNVVFLGKLYGTN